MTKLKPKKTNQASKCRWRASLNPASGETEVDFGQTEPKLIIMCFIGLSDTRAAESLRSTVIGANQQFQGVEGLAPK